MIEQGTGTELVVLAVFDGHGGDEASELASTQLWSNVSRAAGDRLGGAMSAAEVAALDSAALEAAFRQGFLLTHEQMKSAVENLWPKRRDLFRGVTNSTAGARARRHTGA